MFPTTCPVLPLASIPAYQAIHPIHVMTSTIVSECSRTQSGPSPRSGFGSRLSTDPFSYQNLVATTVTSDPSQSAIELP